MPTRSRPIHRLKARTVDTLTSPAGTPTAATSTSRSRQLARSRGASSTAGRQAHRDRARLAARGLARPRPRARRRGAPELEAGENPKRARRTTGEDSFGACAEQLIASLRPSWRSDPRLAMADHAPEGRRAASRPIPVDKITTEDVLAVLSPLWQTKRTTAERLRGRIERVLDAAKARGLSGQRQGEPGPLARAPRPHPAQAGRHEGPPSRRAATREVPAFVRGCGSAEGIGRAGAGVRDPDRSALRRGTRRALGRDRPRGETWTGPGRRMKSRQDASRAAVARGARDPQPRTRPARASSCSPASAALDARCCARLSDRPDVARRPCTASAPPSATGRRRRRASRAKSAEVALAHGSAAPSRAPIGVPTRSNTARAHGALERVLHRGARHSVSISGELRIGTLAIASPVGAKRTLAARLLRGRRRIVLQRSACPR